MSAWACAIWVASLPCALSILNSDELYPAIWKAFVKYGKSELTHLVDEVVSGIRTPTRPLPAACKSFSVAMADKLTSNEETLSDDGIVAGEAVAVPPPPHAITTSPTINSVGTSFANLMLSPLKGVTCCLLLGGSGARVRRHTGPTQQPWLTATRAEHCSWLAVCQENVKDRPDSVQTLDKLAVAAMIACGGGKENDDQTRRRHARVAARAQSRAGGRGAAHPRAYQPGRHRPIDGFVANDSLHAGR